MATSFGFTARQVLSKSKSAAAEDFICSSVRVPDCWADGCASRTTIVSSVAPDRRTVSTYWASQTSTRAPELARMYWMASGADVL